MINSVPHRILRFKDIPSTHMYAMQNGDRMSDGDVVCAEFQSAGRGRLSRRWSAPRGKALLFSMVLKPQIAPERAPLITPVLSVALAEALGDFGVESKIVWPNDIVAAGGKIAGVLAEAKIEGGRLIFVAAGAGVNVGQSESELAAVDRPASSIFSVTGGEPGADDVMNAVLRRFDSIYRLFIEEGFGAVAGQWRSRMALAGDRIELDFGNRRVNGKVAGFGDDGSIIVDQGGGNLTSHSSGEVSRLAATGEGVPC